MRNFTKSLLTLALLVFAVGGAKAGRTYWTPAAPWAGYANSTWDSGTNTFSWNGTHDVVRAIQTGFSGDLSEYTKFYANVASIIGGADHLYLKVNSEGGTEQLIDLAEGQNTIDLYTYFSAIDATNVNTFELWAPKSSETECSAVVTDVYLYKPATFEFDAFGKGTIDKGDLEATGGLSYEASTGVLTSDGTAGTLVFEFKTPVDLKNLFHFNVVRSGTDDIISRLKFYDEEGTEINTWNSIKLSNTWNAAGIDNNATNAFLNHKPVKKLVWESDANASNNGKTLTITRVEFTCKTIACAKAGETQLKTLAWNKIDNSGTATPDWNMNGSSDTYYGNYSGDATHYADLTAYSELRVYCKDNNTGFRCFFINSAGNGTNQIHTASATWHAEEKYYSLDLSAIEKWDSKVALKSIKAENDREPSQRYVTNIVVYNTPAANAPQYILTGSGIQLAETVAALADAKATCIDATGVTGITTNSEAGRTLLTSANPNCLFLGTTGDGGLANTNNVITSGTCAQLELTDGKPFKAPSAFTATNAKFKKTVSAAQYATMVVPFDVASLPTSPSTVTAYNLTAVAGEKITSSSTATLTADKPVLIHTAEGNYEFTASDVNIEATADGEVTNGLLNASYAGTTAAVSEHNYVLQNSATYGVNFYQVKKTAATMLPFRAYLVTPSDAPVLFLDFGNEVTGINDVRSKMADVRGEVYNLNGQRVAQPTKGLYIVNGKKVVIK